MNNTVIDIPGIHVNQEVHDLQYSTDQVHVLNIKDDHGGVVKITVCFGKITKVEVHPLIEGK